MSEYKGVIYWHKFIVAMLWGFFVSKEKGKSGLFFLEQER